MKSRDNESRAGFDDLVNLMSRLRGEDGCPWDREQTPSSLKPYILEEAYEVIAAIEEEDWQELPSELGDLLLQVVFQARIAEEEGRFDIGDVTAAVVEKMTRRHPHVFGDREVGTAEGVMENWEKIKEAESPGRSLTAGVDRRLPALLRAQRIQEKVSRVGFDWSEAAGAMKKLDEELGEFRHAAEKESRERVEEEIGDVFFSLVNVARLSGFNAEEALRKATSRFDERFRKVEKALSRKGRSLDGATLEEMEELWQEAKGNSSGQ